MGEDVVYRIKKMMGIREKKAAQVASEAQLSRATMSRILNGERTNLAADTLKKIAVSLDTTVDYLTGATNDYGKSDAPPMPEYAIEVVESMRRLDRIRNYEILLLARAFVEESESIREISQDEIQELLLDLGDEVIGEEGTNRVMRILELLEQKRRLRGFFPPDNSKQPHD